MEIWKSPLGEGLAVQANAPSAVLAARAIAPSAVLAARAIAPSAPKTIHRKGGRGEWVVLYWSGRFYAQVLWAEILFEVSGVCG
jgi:hypothetical protein